jgi:hypothetical protein
MSPPVRFNFLNGSLNSEVVLWDFSAGKTDAQVCTTYRIEVWNRLKPFVCGSTQLVSISSGSTAAGFILPVGEFGAGVGTAFPPNCAYVLTKKVTGGRSGRAFWPGCGTTYVDDQGQVRSTQMTAINTALASALIGLVNAGSSLSVRDKLGTVRPVTSWTVNQVMGTQRRRLRN